MFEFSKRDSAAKQDDFPTPDEFTSEAGHGSPSSQARHSASPSTRRDAAVIGPSIHIDGDLRGEEDLIIEGEVKGAIHLKSNSLTIGSQGRVTADVYAHTIYVDGFMQGDLYGAERVSIRKSAQVRGNVISPRVSLEDGARFKGSIEMDPDAEALQKAFGGKREAPGSTAAQGSTSTAKPAAVGTFGGTSSPGKPDDKSSENKVAAAKGGAAG